jgi:hypothetical protein
VPTHPRDSALYDVPVRRLAVLHSGLTARDGGNADIAGANYLSFPHLLADLQLPSASSYHHRIIR